MLSGLSALGQLSLFLASLFMLWMILKVLLQFTQRKSEGTNGASGQMPISYWRQEIKKAIREELEYWDRGRLEKFRTMIREELRDR